MAGLARQATSLSRKLSLDNGHTGPASVSDSSPKSTQQLFHTLETASFGARPYLLSASLILWVAHPGCVPVFRHLRPSAQRQRFVSHRAIASSARQVDGPSAQGG